MAAAKKIPGLAGKLMGGLGKSKGEPAPEPDSDLSDGAQALSDFRDSMDSGDFEGAYEAFERAVALCKPAEEMTEAEGDGSEVY
jgi:hypothetical protein